MISLDKKEKINRFLKDERMVEAVRESIISSFLQPQKEKDIYYLAASRVAIDLLDAAWKDLYRFKEIEGDGTPENKNIGL